MMIFGYFFYNVLDQKVFCTVYGLWQSKQHTVNSNTHCAVMNYSNLSQSRDLQYLPGLSNEGSIKSGLFVAPMTNKLLFCCKPSNSDKS